MDKIKFLMSDTGAEITAACREALEQKGVEVTVVEKDGLKVLQKMAMARAFYSSRVDLLEHCLGELEPAIAPYILRGVTEGHSYEALRIKGCPCCKDTYYNNYRKFFWILSRERA